jgi:hypothetical protein
MLNDIFNSLNPIEEDGLQVFKGHLTPDLAKGHQDFFSRVKYHILSFLLQHAE